MKKEDKYRLDELKDFFIANGHCYVPNTKRHTELYHWLSRVKQNRENLHPSVAKRLEELSIDWTNYNTPDLYWFSRFYQLKEYRRKYGHTWVKKGELSDESLYNWVKRQRSRRKGMNPFRKKLLNELDFIWNVPDYLWAQNYELLEDACKKNGHTYISGDEGTSLQAWCGDQRRNRKNGTLATDRISLLDKIGFVWDGEEHKIWLSGKHWREMHEELTDYFSKYKHTRVDRYRHPELYYWIRAQRNAFKKRELESKKIKLLEAAGIVWEGRSFIKEENHKNWMIKYQKLVYFKKQFGHSSVPISHEDGSLSIWVGRMRQLNKKNTLAQEYKELLDSLDFVWDFDEDAWENQFRALCQFKSRHGHCNVPLNKPPTKLGAWVSWQRTYRRTGKLSLDRTQKLDKIGFCWDGVKSHTKRRMVTWLGRLEELRSFKKENGHTHIKSNNPNPNLKKLSYWCFYQRKYASQGTLSPEKIRLLDQLDFQWSVPNPNRSNKP